jgi:hypothetical protein
LVKIGFGSLVTIWTVCGSTIFTSAIELISPFRSEVGDCARSMENFTSVAVKSDPSWNLTPLRRANSHVVGLTNLKPVASHGVSFMSLSL